MCFPEALPDLFFPVGLGTRQIVKAHGVLTDARLYGQRPWCMARGLADIADTQFGRIRGRI